MVDYAMKAQALAYDSHRAMFEAFGRIIDLEGKNPVAEVETWK